VLAALWRAVKAGNCNSPQSHPVFDTLHQDLLDAGAAAAAADVEQQRAAAATDGGAMVIHGDGAGGFAGLAAGSYSLPADGAIDTDLESIDRVARRNRRWAPCRHVVWGVVGLGAVTAAIVMVVLLLTSVLPWPEWACRLAKRDNSTSCSTGPG
jgi:hypothetical protein